MSQLVKTKRQANFKDFKRFGAFKGFVEQKNVVFNSFVCKLGLFLARVGHFKTRVKHKHTQTRQINYYLRILYSNEQYYCTQNRTVIGHFTA
jgi:hypothetical protein